MDLDAVRTFVAVADAGRFADAAAELSITQQAVSKRVVALEKDLGARLFARTPRGARLSIDGQAFLPYARELLRAEERAAASVRPGRRALRVDVIGRKLAPAHLLRDFHRAHPGTDLDVVTLYDVDTAVEALRSGTIDASFRAVTMPGRRLPAAIEAVPVHAEPIQLLTGPAHPLATAGSVTPADLPAHPIWMPSLIPGTEWAAFYADLSATFAFTIDTAGPNFGLESLVDVLADSATLATLVGAETHVLWPTHYDLRRIPLHAPTPVYPHALLSRRDTPHPAVPTLRTHLTRRHALPPDAWTPDWALTAR